MKPWVPFRRFNLGAKALAIELTLACSKEVDCLVVHPCRVAVLAPANVVHNTAGLRS